MKKKKYYNLMEGDEYPHCKDGGSHKFIAVRYPSGHRSGWHEDLCEICGIIVGYDTSD